MTISYSLDNRDWQRSRSVKRRNRRGLSKKVLIGGLIGLVLSSFAVFGVFLYANRSPDITEQLDTALRFFRNGDSALASRLATAINPKQITKKSDQSKRHFLIGVNEQLRAKSIDQRPIANDLNEKAVFHLEKSRDYSFPDGYGGAGNYHLGMALFALFRWDDAETPLSIAAERWPMGRSDAYERLVDIELSHSRQDPEAAIDKINYWRTLPRSSAYDDDRATVKEMEARLVANELDEVIGLLPTISKTSPHYPKALLVSAKAMLQKGEDDIEEETKKHWLNLSLAALKDVMKSPRIDVELRRQANLILGLVYRALGQHKDAVSTLSILRLSSPFEPESLAAGLYEIDSLVELNRFRDAIDTLEHITSNLGELKWYQNDWFPLSEMRRKLVTTGNKLIKLRQYSTAASFAKLLPPFCDQIDKTRLESHLYEEWALEQEKSKAIELTRQEHYKKSAQAFEHLTRALPRDPEFDDWLWHAIENYRKAGAYKESNLLLERFLALESRTNRPRGYLVRASNYKSLDRPSDAIASLEQLLASNTNTPLAFDARLELAKLKVKQEQFDEAEALIRENLSGDLKPESPIWRESLYELGTMLFSRGEKQLLNAKNEMEANPSKTLENFSRIEASHDQLKRSVDRLEEFQRRFDKDPRRFQMLYHMAKAYQLAAFWPELQLRENRSTNEDTITALKAQRKELLVRSRNSYSKLRQEILSETDRTAQGSNIDDLLRNSYFGEADLFFFEEDYEDAMAAYSDAANRFINEPESLEARKQIALCQRYMGKYQDCRRSLELAKDLLKRIPSDKDSKFKTVTSHDREEWGKYLDGLLVELNSIQSP